ncbi:hypothetical protein HN652_01105 [archaeon]|jgi:hypothetical protein|nr:hypothetical protein [archaeon]MBT6868910.1 hypothetical protein [archaeon]MBT7192869.1 hypothetical protein [archaeon]MBT7380835.1 hypothetical protein [archaeon]MBT7507590.1 hypothetical protein [archaeon]
MVRINKTDGMALKIKYDELNKKKIELKHNASNAVKHFILELSAEFGKKFGIRKYWEQTFIDADIYMGGTLIKKKIGVINLYKDETNTILSTVAISLYVRELDQKFTKQVKLFERYLKSKGLMADFNQIVLNKNFK